MQTYVSGRSDTAVVHDGDHWHTVTYGANIPTQLVPEGVAVELMRRMEDIRTFKSDSTDSARDQLEEVVDQTEALDLFLLLLDPGCSRETREAASEELDEVIHFEEIYGYVRDILLSSPLPKDADGKVALAIVKEFGHEKAELLLRQVLDLQTAIIKVQNAWHSLDPDSIIAEIPKNQVASLLAQEGLFRSLVDDITEGNKTFAGFKFTALQNNAFKEVVSNTTAVVNALSSALGDVRERPTHDLRTEARETNTDITVEPKHRAPSDAFNAAVSQVDRISSMFSAEQDEGANKMLAQLIEEQTRHSNGEEYVVKSLCNIAQQVRKKGLPDTSLSCLLKALEFKSGIDARLLQQLGHELRQISQYDEALECFKAAQILEIDDSALWRLSLDTVKILVDRGKYSDAQDEYLKMLSIRDDSDTRFALGTVYRKNGELRLARDAFNKCLTSFSGMHRAKAGIAEVTRQGGKPHKAIGQYNSIVRSHSGSILIDDGSARVYDLARSSLFRQTVQHRKSESILLRLLSSSPRDNQANFHLAKLLLLQNNSQEARRHFTKASRASHVDIGRLVLEKLMGIQEPTRLDDVKMVTPEHVGAVACLKAYDALQTQEFDRVESVLAQAHHVNRYVQDFAWVLSFHAQRRLNNMDYRSSYQLCRIAKRGDRGLRNAVKEIACDRFDNATRLEADFFLRVA